MNTGFKPVFFCWGELVFGGSDAVLRPLGANKEEKLRFSFNIIPPTRNPKKPALCFGLFGSP